MFLLIGFLVWLLFLPWKRAQTTSIESGTVNRAFVALAGPATQNKTASAQSEQQAEIRQFNAALDRERLKLTEIGSALNLYNSADAILVNRNGRGLTDPFGLSAALEGLSTLMAHEIPGQNLLDEAQLDSHVQAARHALDELERQGSRPGLTPSEILTKRNSIPQLFSAFHIDPLYNATQRVENSLKQTMNTEVGTGSAYSSMFDRGSDELTTEQKTYIDLAGHQAIRIDVSGFVPDTPPAVKVAIQEDSLAPRELSASSYRVELHPETKRLAVTRTITEAHASYPLLTDRIWTPFRAISLNWPFPLFSSIELFLRFPEDPSLTWPLGVPIKTDPSASLTRVLLPRYSFYFSGENMKYTTTAANDELAPDTSAPKLIDLATGRHIKIELLPWYLSNSKGQEYKDFFELENILAALIFAGVSAAFAGIVSWFSPSNAPTRS